MTHQNYCVSFLLSLSLLLPTFCANAEGKTNIAASHKDEVTFLTGGIGEEERLKMREVRATSNLRLTFALKKSGEYLTDVKVSIVDKEGKEILQSGSSGPLLYAKLPPGIYKVSAQYRQKVFSRRTEIKGTGSKELYFYWDVE